MFTTYVTLAILLVLTHLSAFLGGAVYGYAKLRACAAELMNDLDAQLEHLGVRITEEAHEKLNIAVAWIRHRLGIK